MEISFTSVFVMQQNYRYLTFEQLQDAEGDGGSHAGFKAGGGE